MSTIRCLISYDADSVLCFDPQKVLSKLAKAFPEVQIDSTDLTGDEGDRVKEFVKTSGLVLAEQGETMLRQIEGKQQRNGPRYRFQLSEKIHGFVGRYSFVVTTKGRFADADSERIRDFMATLGAGVITEHESD